MSLPQITAPNKITVSTNHWRVPTAERAFDGLLVGTRTKKGIRKRLVKALSARAVWKPSQEGMHLVEQLRAFIGFRVQMQFWDPIMYMLEDEGPFPLEADCINVVILQDGDFLQAYLIIDNVREIPASLGYSPYSYLGRRDNISGQLVSLANLYEIWAIEV